ncbi:hypothetical protein B0J14DRAFT_576457, partial [Halenospora varia]
MEEQPNNTVRSDTTSDSNPISVVTANMSSLDLRPTPPILIPIGATPTRSGTTTEWDPDRFRGPSPIWIHKSDNEEDAAECLNPPNLSTEDTIPFLTTPPQYNNLISRHALGVPAGIMLVQIHEPEEMKLRERPMDLFELYDALRLYLAEALQHSGEEVMLQVQKSVVEKIDIQAEIGEFGVAEHQMEIHTRYLEKFRALDPDVRDNVDKDELRNEVFEDIMKDKESRWANSSKEQLLTAINNFVDHTTSWGDRREELGDILRDMVKFAEGKGTMTDSKMGQPRLAVVVNMDWIRVIRWEAEYYCWILEMIKAEVDEEVLHKVKVLIDLVEDPEVKEVVSAD